MKAAARLAALLLLAALAATRAERATAAPAVACRTFEARSAEPGDAPSLAPMIFQWTKQARGGHVIGIQGAHFDETTRVWIEEPGGEPVSLPILNRVGATWLATEVPQQMDGPLRVRLSNIKGFSQPILLNAPEPVHFDATEAAPGARVRIFGRNLVFPGCDPVVTLDGLGADVIMSASSPEMLVVRAPDQLEPGRRVEVRVDTGGGLGDVAAPSLLRIGPRGSNGLGLDAPWSASFDFLDHVRRPDVACDGTQDVASSLNAAILDISHEGGGVIELPHGVCRLRQTIDMASNTILRGAGADKTILVYESKYPISALGRDRIGLENLQVRNAGGVEEPLIWRRNTRSFLRNVRLDLATSRQIFLTENENMAFVDNVVTQSGSFDHQVPFRFDDSIGLLFKGNHCITSSGAPTFLRVGAAAILGNRFTRDARAQFETPVVVHHGLVLDFSREMTVADNLFDVVNGPIVSKSRNDGEAILVEGGGANRTESLGEVEAAGSRTLTLRGKSPDLSIFGSETRANYGIFILDGKGAGQMRRIVEVSGTSVTLDQPWAIQPRAGDRYASFVWSLDRVAIARNRIVDYPRGVWLYQAALNEVTVADNDMEESGGIYLRTFQDVSAGQVTVQTGTLITGNRIRNSSGRWMSYVTVAAVTKDIDPLGVVQAGVVIRANTVLANERNLTSVTEDYASAEGFSVLVRVESQSSERSSSPFVLGAILQNNVCERCARPYTIGFGQSGTTLIDNQPGVAKRGALRDLDRRDRPLGGSSFTYVR